MKIESENNTSGSVSALPEEAQENLPQVEHILKSLTKLIHGRKLYAENNPRLLEFSKEFENALKSFFRGQDELALEIDQQTIRWEGNCVYENNQRDDSIAFLLHRDGVGEITIGSGAMGKEIDRLVKILTEEYYNLSSDEDVVTKFWNADFEHVSYRVLDDYLSSEYGEGRKEDGGEQIIPDVADHPEILPSLEDKGRVIISQSDSIESIDAYLKKLIMRTCPSQDEAEKESYFQSMVGSFFTVSNEEINLYHEELEKSKSYDNLASFVETIIVFTLLKDNPSAVRDVCGVVERIIEYTIEELDPRTLGQVLTSVRNFRDTYQAPEDIAEFTNGLESKITQDSVIQSLGEKLKDWNKDTEATLRYFVAVGRTTVETLLKVLHNLEGEDRLHKEICDALIDVAGPGINGVIESLDIDKPEVAFDAVYIANKIGISEMLPKIRELLFYPDVKIKEEMIKLVSRVDDAEGVNLLITAMGDEDKRIRLRAMEAATHKNDARVREKLSEIAFGKTEMERSADEQEAVFRALGRVGDAGTVDQLKKLVEKKNFMQFGKQKENKFLAIRALENIHSPAAVGLLKQLAGDSNSLVQTRARRAYDALVKAMRAEREKETPEEES